MLKPGIEDSIKIGTSGRCWQHLQIFIKHGKNYWDQRKGNREEKPSKKCKNKKGKDIF